MPKKYLGLKPTGPVETEVAPIDMLGPVSMRFRPVLPTDEQAMWMIGLQLWTAGAISHETLLEKFGQMDDPLGEIDRVTVDQALKDPQLMAQVVGEALKRAGIAPPPPAASGILGPDGQPLPPSGAPTAINGQAASGLPAVPGLNMPTGGQQSMRAVPKPGESSMAEHHAGAQAHELRTGAYPGLPGNQR